MTLRTLLQNRTTYVVIVALCALALTAVLLFSGGPNRAPEPSVDTGDYETSG